MWWTRTREGKGNKIAGEREGISDEGEEKVREGVVNDNKQIDQEGRGRKEE